MEEQQTGKRDVYKYFLFERFKPWWVYTVSSEILEEEFERGKVTLLETMKQKSAWNTAAMLQLALAAGGFLFTDKYFESVGMVATSLATLVKSWRTSSKEDKELEFTAQEAHDWVEDRRQKVSGFHVGNNGEYEKAMYMLAEAGKLPDVSSGFKNTSIAWEKNFKGITLKVIPYAKKVFDTMGELDKARREKLRIEASKAVNKDGTVGMDEEEFRRTNAGVRIEDDYACRILSHHNTLLEKYLDAAKREDKKVENNLKNPDVRKKAEGNAKALYNTFDLLFRAGQEFTGTSTWNQPERLIEGEVAFSHTRFCFDLKEELIEQADKGGSIVKMNVFRSIKASESPLHEELEEIMKKGYCASKDTQIAITDDRYMQDWEGQRDAFRREIAKYEGDKYHAVRVYREGMFKIAQLEDQRSVRQSLYDKYVTKELDADSAKAFEVSLRKDKKIVEEINKEIENIATTCETSGYEREARIIRLAAFGASKLHVDIRGVRIPLEERLGAEYDKAMAELEPSKANPILEYIKQRAEKENASQEVKPSSWVPPRKKTLVQRMKR